MGKVTIWQIKINAIALQCQMHKNDSPSLTIMNNKRLLWCCWMNLTASTEKSGWFGLAVFFAKLTESSTSQYHLINLYLCMLPIVFSFFGKLWQHKIADVVCASYVALWHQQKGVQACLVWPVQVMWQSIDLDLSFATRSTNTQIIKFTNTQIFRYTRVVQSCHGS